MSDKKHWKNRDFEGYKAKSTGFSWKKLLLFILSTVFDILVLLNIVFLIGGRISHTPGVILLIVAIGFSLLCKSLWRRSIASIGSIVVIFVLALLLTATLCAYAGIEPYVSLKNSLFMWASELAISVWEKLISSVEFLRTLLIEKR